jgi:FKBP-type peptidyl-prolyl cis-trans isomerase FklB
MKRISVLLISTLVILSSCGKLSKPKLASEKDTITYFIGLMQAKGLKQNLKQSDFEGFKPEVYARAFQEVFKGDSIKFTDMQIQTKLQSYFQKMQAQSSEKALKEGQEFLEKNKKNPGVVVTPSGLQYQIIKEGTGPKPDSSDAVSVYYKGTLIDGKEFDSSKGTPVSLSLRGVFPGMTEALLKMGVGSKWKLFIPSHLAYGENPRPGGLIKPNMALIFEVEVLGIEPKKKEEKPGMPQIPAKPKKK